MDRTSSKRLASFTTAQALQMILNDSDSDENDNSEDSGTEYEDHLSEVSDHVDVEAAVDSHDGDVATISAIEEHPDSSEAETVSDAGRRREQSTRSYGRGRGRRQGSDGRADQAAAQTESQSIFGKNKFTWDRNPPTTGRRREQDIIRHAPGITALARSNEKSLVEVFQFFVTKEMVDNIVLQTNREARRRIRALE